MNLESLYAGPGLPDFVGLGGVAGLLFVLLIIWSLVWKGLALWRAARLGSKVWFVVLLIVNTVGILEILYLYVFSKKSSGQVPPPSGASNM